MAKSRIEIRAEYTNKNSSMGESTNENSVGKKLWLFD